MNLSLAFRLSFRVWRRRLKAKLNTFIGGDMLDLIFLATTILFFLLALAYARGCEKL